MRFLVIPVSHYCERARWALDLAGLSYSEEHYLPMFNRAPSRRAGGTGTLPVLVDGGTVLSDSGDIVSFAAAQGTFVGNARLAPADAELERRLAGAFGVATRRLAYSHFLGDRELVLRYSTGLAPRWQVLALRVGYHFAMMAMRRMLAINDESVAAAVRLIDDTLDEVAEWRQDGRRYLGGDELSSLDITFASLAAPLVAAEGYGVPLPEASAMSPAARDMVRRYREHPAGRYALELYAERPPSPIRARLSA